MDRGRKIVLLAHCLLNVNTKVEGLAHTQAGSVELITELLQRGYGLMQLRCTEQWVCGIKRWGQVKEQLSHPHYRECCQRLLQPLVQQLEDFAVHGYHLAGVIGIDGSPTCGVNYTCSGNWGGELAHTSFPPQNLETLHTIPEAGVMMEELQKMLAAARLNIPFLAVKEDDQQNYTAELLTALESLDNK